MCAGDGALLEERLVRIDPLPLPLSLLVALSSDKDRCFPLGQGVFQLQLVFFTPKRKEPNSWACADSWRGCSKCVGPTCCSSPPVGGLTVAMDVEGILCMAFNVCMRRFNNIHLSGTPQHHLSLVNTRWIPYCYASFLGNTTLHWFRRYPGPFRGNS